MTWDVAHGSDDEEDTAELLRELEKIKAEKEVEARKRARLSVLLHLKACAAKLPAAVEARPSEGTWLA